MVAKEYFLPLKKGCRPLEIESDGNMTGKDLDLLMEPTHLGVQPCQRLPAEV
jgi:hypothetical protein